MRLNEILKEALEWGNGQDKDIYMSFKGLVNKNNGVFKSKKQQWFITNKIVKHEHDRSRAENMQLFGVETGDGEKLVTVDAIARWADYGSRSQVPVRYGFVMDNIGVAKFYRIGNKGNMADGASPDPSKTKLEWERPADADSKHLERTEAEKKKEFQVALGMSEGSYLGTEGERMSFGEVELVAKKYMGDSQFGYNQSTPKYWNMYKNAEGSVIYHTGKEGPEKGEKLVLTATVKKHLVSKRGDKVTVVIRPRFKTVESVAEDIVGGPDTKRSERLMKYVDQNKASWSRQIARDAGKYELSQPEDWWLDHISKGVLDSDEFNDYDFQDTQTYYDFVDAWNRMPEYYANIVWIDLVRRSKKFANYRTGP